LDINVILLDIQAKFLLFIGLRLYFLDNYQEIIDQFENRFCGVS